MRPSATATISHGRSFICEQSCNLRSVVFLSAMDAHAPVLQPKLSRLKKQKTRRITLIIPCGMAFCDTDVTDRAFTKYAVYHFGAW